MSHLHPGYVSDGIERTGWIAADDHTKVTDALTWLIRFRRSDGETAGNYYR